MKPQLSLFCVALALWPSALAAQTPAVWEAAVKVVATGGSLTKSAGCEGCPDSGAHTVTQLNGDGAADFVPASGHRIIAGLGTDLSASTDASAIDFAFGFWPGGTWEIRERGVYKSEGAFTAGDSFRVAVEAGRVVYRRNGTTVYTSTVQPSYPLAFDVTFFSLNAGITGATIASGGPSQDPPPPPPPTSGPPVLTAVGPYEAVIDRRPHAKPVLPMIGPAGTTIQDPVFMSMITRVTDGATRPGVLNRSYRTPSSVHQNAWSAAGSYFYAVAGDGTVIPFAFDAATGSARRLQPTTSGAGGLTLKFYIEPTFSRVTDSRIYGSYSGSGATLRTIDEYDFKTGAYVRLLDLDQIVPGLAGTYVGSIASSAGPTERLMTFFGGTQQDRHHYIAVFDRANPANRLVLDTTASTLNGAPTSMPLNFLLHAVNMDRSGRYLMIYPTAADQSGPRKASQAYLWDTYTGRFTDIAAALPYGHDTFGYGVWINQACCTATSWDAAQWQFRSLSTPLQTRDIITTPLSPKEVYLADHSTWNNAKPDQLVPYVSALYRYGLNTAEWRAWDDEIVAIQTDAAPGADATVWRFAHHRSNLAHDLDPARATFWYMPRPNVSPDGRWVLFTSNWEKTLGMDPAGDSGAGARQDVFLVELKPATTEPPVQPVTIGTSALPAGRATVAYSAALEAAGGSGAFAWAVASGSLPAGLALDGATGTIAGTPQSGGTFSFVVAAADAADASNVATASVSLLIANAPVSLAAQAVAPGRVSVPYIATLAASGGSGTFAWSIASGALPSGLTLDAGTGVIAGTPETGGAFSFVVAAADAADASNVATASVALLIANAPVSLAGQAVAPGRVSVPYIATLAASGGSGTFAWSIASGALPSGLTLDAGTGVIAGTPLAEGTYSITVTAADASEPANAASTPITIAVLARPVAILTTALPAGRATIAYNGSLSVTAGTVTWAISSGSLPPGIVLNAATGALSGTPTTGGTWNISVTATSTSDATNTVTGAFAIAIVPGVKVTSPRSIPAGKLGVPYVYAVQAENVVGVPSWGLAGGSLPHGFTLNAATGVIAGTPGRTGTWNFNVRVKDASTDDTLTLTLKITK